MAKSVRRLRHCVTVFFYLFSFSMMGFAGDLTFVQGNHRLAVVCIALMAIAMWLIVFTVITLTKVEKQLEEQSSPPRGTEPKEVT